MSADAEAAGFESFGDLVSPGDGAPDPIVAFERTGSSIISILPAIDLEVIHYAQQHAAGS